MSCLVLAILFAEHKEVFHPHCPLVRATPSLLNRLPALVPQPVNLMFDSRDGSKQSHIIS